MNWLELYAQLKVYEWLVGAVVGGSILAVWLMYIIFTLFKDVVIPLAKVALNKIKN